MENVENIEKDDFKMEDIPIWITHYGFILILTFLILIPILLLNYEYSIKVEGYVTGTLVSGDKVAINIIEKRGSQFKQNQKVIFNFNEKRMTGVIFEIKDLYLEKSIQGSKILIFRIQEDKDKAPPKKNTIIVNQGSLFYKVFTFF